MRNFIQVSVTYSQTLAITFREQVAGLAFATRSAKRRDFSFENLSVRTREGREQEYQPSSAIRFRRLSRWLLGGFPVWGSTYDCEYESINGGIKIDSRDGDSLGSAASTGKQMPTLLI